MCVCMCVWLYMLSLNRHMDALVHVWKSKVKHQVHILFCYLAGSKNLILAFLLAEGSCQSCLEFLKWDLDMLLRPALNFLCIPDLLQILIPLPYLLEYWHCRQAPSHMPSYVKYCVHMDLHRKVLSTKTMVGILKLILSFSHMLQAFKIWNLQWALFMDQESEWH